MDKLINLISPFVANCFDDVNQFDLDSKYLILKKGCGREAGLTCLMWCGKFIGCSGSGSGSGSSNKLYLFEHNDLDLSDERDKCTYVFYELNNLYSIDDIIQFIKTNCVCTTRTHNYFASDFYFVNTTLKIFYNTIGYGGDGFLVNICII